MVVVLLALLTLVIRVAMTKVIIVVVGMVRVEAIRIKQSTAGKRMRVVMPYTRKSFLCVHASFVGVERPVGYSKSG